MIKRLILRLLTGIALTFAPVAEAQTIAPAPAAAPASSGVPTIQDVLDTCAGQSAPEQAACAAYVNATLQTADIMSAAAHGGTPTPLFCLKEGMRPQDIVAVIRLQLDGHPDRRTYPAPTAIIGGAVDAYPCAKTVAAPAAPVRHAKKRRTTQH